jgi:hypothetical protein
MDTTIPIMAQAAKGDQKHNLAATTALDLPRGAITLSGVDSLMVGWQGSSEKARCQSFEAANQSFALASARGRIPFLPGAVIGGK